MRGLFREEPLRLRAAPEVLELPLRPSSRLRCAQRTLVIALLLYMLELLLTGHRVAAVASFMLMAGGSWPWRSRSSGRPAIPRKLVLAKDGGLSLGCADGSLHEVQLCPESLRLGPHVLLVLAGQEGRIRLLFGPDNLAPAQLAALLRRLPAGTASPATALHSAPASRRSDHP